MAQVPLPGAIRGRQTYTDDGGGYQSQENAQKAKTPSADYWKRTYQMINDYRNSLNTTTPRYYGGGGGYSAPVIEQPDYSAWFNALAKIENDKYNALQKTILQARQRADEMNNMSKARNLREWSKVYKDRRNGQGLSSRFDINYNYDNTARAIGETFDTNNANLLAGRYSDLASLTQLLPNMNSETIKKIMSNLGSLGI